MEKESLEKTRTAIIKVVKELEIDDLDKVELILNIYHFLDKDKYEENIKTLRRV